MKKLIASIAVFFMMVPTVTLASVIRTDNIRQDENITENVYISGGSPVVAGTIQGDLVTSGGNVFVSGNVQQDVWVAAGSVNITGHVGGDLRVFSGNVFIDAPVDGELFVIGGSVTVGPHATVNGDVHITAGQVVVDPAVRFASSNVTILTDEKENHDESKPMFDTNKFLTAIFWLSQLFLIISILVVVVVVHLLFPNFIKKVLQRTTIQKNGFWKSFLTGFIVMVVMPIAAIIAFITGIGGFLGALILFGFILFLLSSILMSGVIFGGMLCELISKSKKNAFNIWWLLLGVVGLHVVTLIPFVGWIIGFLFFLAAWGGLATVKFYEMKA